MHVLAIPFYVQLTQGFVQQDLKKHLWYTGDFLTNFQFSQKTGELFWNFLNMSYSTVSCKI